MKLDNRVLRVIAVGASITANCQPCLQINIQKARASGVGEQEIAEAIEVGKAVRRGAASKMDQFASSLNSADTSTANVPDSGCECHA